VTGDRIRCSHPEPLKSLVPYDPFRICSSLHFHLSGKIMQNDRIRLVWESSWRARARHEVMADGLPSVCFPASRNGSSVVESSG
jgi:hypothetical protein